MEIGEVFYPKMRSEWRDWLEKNHTSKNEIWLRRFKKATGKPCISYDDLVEECLCFGWIDGVIKRYDEESNVQRISPRRKKKSFLSELNRQRIWKLQREGRMTPAGLEIIGDQVGSPNDPWEIPEWIEKQLHADPTVWKNFQALPNLYRRLKIFWITEAGQSRGPQLQREEMQRRLDYLIKMTRQGKTYGTIPRHGE